MNSIKFFLFCLVTVFPLAANGSSYLVAEPESAYCTGKLTLEWINVACVSQDEPCTFGSEVFVTGQINATVDFPSNTEIKVKPTFAGLPFTGVYSVYDKIVDNVCYSTPSYLSVPGGADANYTCPEKGVYNMHNYFTMWGNASAWYGDLYGYHIGVDVEFWDSDNHTLWSKCIMNIAVVEDEDGGTRWFSAEFLFGATALTGLSAGYLIRKRRIAAAGEFEEGGEDEQGMASHFELINDPSVRGWDNAAVAI